MSLMIVLTKLCLFNWQKAGVSKRARLNCLPPAQPCCHLGIFECVETLSKALQLGNTSRTVQCVTSRPSHWSDLSCPEPPSITHIFCTVAYIVHSLLKSPCTQHSNVLFWHAWLDCKPTATGWWLEWSSMEWCWWNHQNSTHCLAWTRFSMPGSPNANP